MRSRRLLRITLAVALVAAPAGCGDDGGGDEPAAVPEGARRVEVKAKSFEYDPDEITVEAGERVALALRSTDIVHDLTVDQLDVKITAAGGKTKVGGLQAEEPGRYTFYCSIPGHRNAGMEGTLVVE